MSKKSGSWITVAKGGYAKQRRVSGIVHDDEHCWSLEKAGDAKELSLKDVGIVRSAFEILGIPFKRCRRCGNMVEFPKERKVK